MCADNNPLPYVPALSIRLGLVSVKAGTKENPPELSSTLAYWACTINTPNQKSVSVVKVFFMLKELFTNVFVLLRLTRTNVPNYETKITDRTNALS